jgi:hypothetical protein
MPITITTTTTTTTTTKTKTKYSNETKLANVEQQNYSKREK